MTRPLIVSVQDQWIAKELGEGLNRYDGDTIRKTALEISNLLVLDEMALLQAGKDSFSSLRSP